MKVTLVYKGYFDERAAGPEIRYLALGAELHKSGHEVTIVGRASSDSNVRCLSFVPVSSWMKVFSAFLHSDVIVLHGGGPLLLLSAIWARLWGAGLVLDGYAPHWLELFEGASPSGRRNWKIIFNIGRLVWASAGGVDTIVVANRRQQDLVRGVISVFGRLGSMLRVHVVSNGCESAPSTSGNVSGQSEIQIRNLKQDGFVFGWIGGTWGWFEFSAVMKGLKTANDNAQKDVFLCFFGVSGEQRNYLMSLSVKHGVKDRVVFLPRVPYERRLAVWRHLDATVVWGGETLESNYASRTRNFDSVALGLPIVQNDDGEWSELIEEHGCGVICDEVGLGHAMARVVSDPQAYAEMRNNIRSLASKLSWPEVAKQWLLVFESLSVRPKVFVRIMNSLFAIVSVVLVLPLLALSATRQFR